MKKLKISIVKKIIPELILLLVFAGCSLNNPFLQTEEITPPIPEVLPEVQPVPIPVESVSIQGQQILERYVGDTYSCAYTVLPANADDKTVFFTSSNPKVAAIDENGVITALTIGETVITVTSNGDKTKTAKIIFKVLEKASDYIEVESIAVSPKTKEIFTDEDFLLTVEVLPKDATDRAKVTWTSSDETIAKVNQDGHVTAIAEGEVTITATSVNSKIFDTATIKVKRKLNPKVTVTSPNGGEEVTFKSSTTITWTIEDIDCEKVKVELVDYTQSPEKTYLIADDVENYGNCYWYINSDAEYSIGENYKIRITTIPDADESTDVVVTDESDEVFKLKKIVPTIELTSPTSRGKDENGNEKDNYFYLYDTINMNIRWLSTDMPDDKVAIYLVKQNGDNTNDFTQVAEIVENADNNGLFIWNLGKFVSDSNISLDELADENSKYKIKIENLTYNDTLSAEEYEKNKVESISDVTFSLEKVESPFLKFLSPTGKKLYIGTQNDITWEGVGFDSDVKIELVPEEKNKPSYSIVDRTPNDGCFEWNISEEVMVNGDFDLGTEYKIRISTIDSIEYNGSKIEIMKDKDGNETRLENPGTLVAEGADSLEAILAPNVYFLLDDSGSMRSGSPSRMEILKRRMDNASVALAKNFNIGMASFHKDKDGQGGLLKLAKGHSAETIRAAYADIDAPWVTPIGPSLEKIRVNKKYELEDDVYNEYRRKAIVVITDGQPQNNTGGLEASFQNAKQESALLAANGVPVFYMGINAGSLTSTLSVKLQEMAVAGGSDNPTDPDRNWYPIDEDSQFEAALNEIMYGDLEVAGSMVEYEIDCGTPDSGNSIYFFGDHLLLGGTTSPASASGLLKATYKDGKYSIKIRKQDNANFSWGIVEADAKGNILKIEKPSLHTSDETSPTFNGWNENVIIIKVAKSLGYNAIYYWSCSNKTSYPDIEWKNRKEMSVSGNDYVYTFLGTTSVKVLITKSTSNESKLCGTDMIASSPGTWRVTSSGIKKEN